MKRPGFTLIELLITSVLFVVVAGYAVTVLSATVSLTEQARRSQGGLAQARQILETIRTSYIHTPVGGSTPSTAVIPSTDVDQPNAVIVIANVSQVDANGKQITSTNTYDYIYCAAPSEQNSARRRLAKFTITNGIKGLASSMACTLVGVGSLYNNTGVITGPEYLTDATTQVQRFEASVAQYDTGNPLNELDAGLRVVLTTINDPSVTDPNSLGRASDQEQTSVTVRMTMPHILTGNAAGFSGL